MIDFTDFGFQYTAQAAPTLSAVNLHIARGEKILISGSSGSGKSTLIHCINGLIPHAYKGTATGAWTLDGADTAGLDLFGFSQKVGTVLQDTDGQFVSLTAAEDIAFAAENDCVPLAELRSRVLDAARSAHIDRHLHKAPHNLSGGQKQRVSLAGILLMDTDILLFDEPLANLDPAAGKQAIELIDELHKSTGKTILIVEHRLEDVLHRSVDRIIIIDKGRIVADTPPAAILASPLLRNYGIREPLYLSALRYAGAAVTADCGPESVHTVRFESAALHRFVAAQNGTAVTNTAPVILELQHISFTYDNNDNSKNTDASTDGNLTLDDISFTIRRGESIALAGRNGAGKSTLAKLICGFLKPAAGSLHFSDSRVDTDLAALSIKERAEHIGYVMQNPNQMISFPMIYDEIAFGLRNRHVPEAEIAERVAEALRICGLYPFRNWPVSALSYGQKKRLTIASILVIGSSLLILDEPTAGQDYRHYTGIMEFLERLRAERGLTYILITHDMHLMLEYADRALVLSNGRLLAYDEPSVILSDDAIIEAASLKRTSLYDLALRAAIADPPAFIRAFIRREKQQRQQTEREAVP